MAEPSMPTPEELRRQEELRLLDEEETLLRQEEDFHGQARRRLTQLQADLATEQKYIDALERERREVLERQRDLIEQEEAGISAESSAYIKTLDEQLLILKANWIKKDSDAAKEREKTASKHGAGHEHEAPPADPVIERLVAIQNKLEYLQRELQQTNSSIRKVSLIPFIDDPARLEAKKNDLQGQIEALIKEYDEKTGVSEQTTLTQYLNLLRQLYFNAGALGLSTDQKERLEEWDDRLRERADVVRDRANFYANQVEIQRRAKEPKGFWGRAAKWFSQGPEWYAAERSKYAIKSLVDAFSHKQTWFFLGNLIANIGAVVAPITVYKHLRDRLGAGSERKQAAEEFRQLYEQVRAEREPSAADEQRQRAKEQTTQKIQHLKKRINGLSYVAEDVREEFVKKVDLIAQAARRATDLEEDRYMREISFLLKDYIVEKTTAMQALKDVFSTATVFSGLYMARGMGLLGLSAVERLIKARHEYERKHRRIGAALAMKLDSPTAAIKGYRSLKEQAGTALKKIIWERAIVSSANEGWRSVTFQGATEKSNTRLKRTLDFLSAVGTGARVFAIGSAMFPATPSDLPLIKAPTDQLDRFNRVLQTWNRGGVMHVVADNWKEMVNRSLHMQVFDDTGQHASAIEEAAIRGHDHAQFNLEKRLDIEGLSIKNAGVGGLLSRLYPGHSFYEENYGQGMKRVDIDGLKLIVKVTDTDIQAVGIVEGGEFDKPVSLLGSNVIHQKSEDVLKHAREALKDLHHQYAPGKGSLLEPRINIPPVLSPLPQTTSLRVEDFDDTPAPSAASARSTTPATGTSQSLEAPESTTPAAPAAPDAPPPPAPYSAVPPPVEPPPASRGPESPPSPEQPRPPEVLPFARPRTVPLGISSDNNSSSSTIHISGPEDLHRDGTVSRSLWKFATPRQAPPILSYSPEEARGYPNLPEQNIPTAPDAVDHETVIVNHAWAERDNPETVKSIDDDPSVGYAYPAPDNLPTVEVDSQQSAIINQQSFGDHFHFLYNNVAPARTPENLKDALFMDKHTRFDTQFRSIGSALSNEHHTLYTLPTNDGEALEIIKQRDAIYFRLPGSDRPHLLTPEKMGDLRRVIPSLRP